MWVVAAAHKKSTGPIDSYDSLNDVHLRSHYHKCLVKQRLASVGLVKCLGHRDKPDARRCTCSASSAASGSRDNASSSGDSGVCVHRDAAATSGCAACGRAALPAALREPVSPYLLPVNPSRKQLMPRPNLQAVSSTAGPRGLRRTSIMPASSSSAREDVAPKNHFPKKSDCKVSLAFHGSGRRAVSEASLSVRVTQQHCGGTSLTVYDSRVARGGTFTFASRRHCGYPFSIVIFVNDIRDVQLSSCCEYRYKVGVRLGGPQGHFSLVRLEGGGPCYRCVLEERLRSLQPLERRQQRSADSLLGDSSGLSSPTTSSEATNQQSIGDDRSPASSTAEQDNIEHSTTASESEQSDGETEPQIVDAAGNGPSSNGTSFSTEVSSSPSQPGTSVSEAVQEQIEGGSESSHLSAETVASELENAPNSFEASSNGGEKLSEKSVHSETGSDASDKNQHKVHRSAVHSSAYFVQDKKKQWGSDECRGESFSSDDDAQTVTVTVHADVHSTP